LIKGLAVNKIVGVQFRGRGKVYGCDSGHFVLHRGDKVVVITEEGPAIGSVCSEPQQQAAHAPERELRKVFRLATPEEIEGYEKGNELEERIYQYILMQTEERALPMCLVCVERQFDGSKVVVYFTSEGRVDFRELVKDLVRRFRIRIEMRQIGVRHEAKMVGGLGTCGRPLCCSTYLMNFAPVTIKMAKEQNLSLNPGKISGMCGRLMCCLAYEYPFYEGAKKHLPKVGKKVNTRRGPGKIVRQNVFRETLTVLLESGEEAEISSSEIVPESPPGKKTRKEP
jgi:cell fate regulator YaaT (PSP1 superfamily)